jgi:hypothetical protein
MGCVLLCEAFPEAAQELVAVDGSRLLTELPAGLWPAPQQEAVVARLHSVMSRYLAGASPPPPATTTPAQRTTARAARPAPPPVQRSGSASAAAAVGQQGGEATAEAAAARRPPKMCSVCGATRAPDGGRLKKCRGCMRAR